MTLQLAVISPVYPACAGMIRVRLLGLRRCGSLPRMRGDDPIFLAMPLATMTFTPHARG